MGAPPMLPRCRRQLGGGDTPVAAASAGSAITPTPRILCLDREHQAMAPRAVRARGQRASSQAVSSLVDSLPPSILVQVLTHLSQTHR